MTTRTRLARTAARLVIESTTVPKSKTTQPILSAVSVVTLVTWPVIAQTDREAGTGVMMVLMLPVLLLAVLTVEI